MKRQYVGCVGKIANAVNVVYASYASRPEHALVAAIAAYVRWRNARARLKNQLRRRLIDPHLDQFPSPMR